MWGVYKLSLAYIKLFFLIYSIYQTFGGCGWFKNYRANIKLLEIGWVVYKLSIAYTKLLGCVGGL